ncbi:hypothetical protein ESZ50_03260 [Weissella muntiaci]|uniref:Uncharacterized protein n=1 Tax=Weissella muntiaci TaxID=2508881 RepID=A0A6C2C830_9LACO|nr:hypothetical protein [Weissella muntiaci]TYC50084.1 hypothetical protein ESZ50_03260 [Weissella muntiaci]
MRIFKYIARSALFVSLFAGLFEANNLMNSHGVSDSFLFLIFTSGLLIGLIFYILYFTTKK